MLQWMFLVRACYDCAYGPEDILQLNRCVYMWERGSPKILFELK